MRGEVGYKKYDVTSATLKWVALITMFIDHVGLALVAYVYSFVHIPTDIVSSERVYWIYLLCRGIGRASFPLFVFLLVEGFFYTRDRAPYMIRLLVFVFISEFPFDMAFTPALIHRQGYFYLGYQNVFFTLAIGFAAMWILEEIYGADMGGIEKIVLTLITVAVAAGMAYLLKTDYNAWGVITIIAGYFMKKRGAIPFWSGLSIVALLTIMDDFEAWAAVIVLPLLLFYHGSRGRRGNRYVFYIAYPVHLLTLYLIRVILWY